MKYANVNGERKEAIKSSRGICPGCGSVVIAKICKDKVDHWAHKSKIECDCWWESETPWHREWKNCFDIDCQEIVHKDKKTGEVHIADVKTRYGWTVEFQHSPISDEERSARNIFYEKIVWVVDGTRRKRDWTQMSKLLSSSVQLKTGIPTYAVDPDYNNRLIREWHNSNSMVFFDFKQVNQNRQRIIWFVLPQLDSKAAFMPQFVHDLFVQAFPAQMFIDSHKNGSFDRFFTREIYDHVNDYGKELYNIRRSYKIYKKNDPKLNWLIGE